MTVLYYGNTRVPVTSAWSAEDRFFLAPCVVFNGNIAICQDVAPGQGKAQFGKPHAQRQRAAIGRGLCDICGRPLASRTKVSLSHARPQPHGANGWAILQVEPMMHRECARIAVDLCPSLRRDAESDSLRIRQVFQWRAQCAVMDEIYVESVTGQRRKALGHAKVELVKWADRAMDWLCRVPGSAAA